jgi:hypothetical protein
MNMHWITDMKLRLMRWYWNDALQQWDLRLFYFGRSRATVWNSGVGHTWNKNGVGGENGAPSGNEYPSHVSPSERAKQDAVEALIRQGWV